MKLLVEDWKIIKKWFQHAKTSPTLVMGKHDLELAIQINKHLLELKKL